MAKSVFICFQIQKSTMNKWPNTQLNGSLDIALSNAHTYPRCRTFQTIDTTELALRYEINRELLASALISRLTFWKIVLQVNTRLVIAQI